MADFSQIYVILTSQFPYFILNTTDQLYKGGKNKCSHPPVKCQKVESLYLSIFLCKYSVFIKTFDFMPTFCTLPERQNCYGKGFKRPILAQVIYFTHLKIFVKEGFNTCTVRAVCHVNDAKKFNLLCFSVGNLVKKDSRMFYL